MLIMSAELSGKSKAIKAKTIRTEGYESSQGQSIEIGIISPRGRADSSNKSRKGMPILQRNLENQDKKPGITFDKATMISYQLTRPQWAML